jgi:probable F420-dependent oxidoreductase
MAHPRRFRFGVQFHTATDGADLAAKARRAEELGYSTAFLPDHFGDQLAPVPALMAIADATAELRIGTLVLDNDYRHPVVLAKELATLDLMSEGRLEAGIGAGWMSSDYDESGIPYDEPATRIDRLQEAITIMKALWRDGSATFSGKHYTVNNAQGLPRPVTKPYPTLVIGGGGRRMLRLAAREADVVGVNPNLRAGYVGPEVAAEATPAKFEERIAWVKEAAGGRLPEIDLQILTFFVQFVPNKREVAENLAPMFGLDADAAMEVPLVLLGTVDEICDTLEERRERYGFNYVVVHDAEIESFGQVVERLAGK